MNIKTTLLLLVLLGLLGSAIWWQKQTERVDRDVDTRLFPGVEVALVDTIRIDNIERSFNLRLERDSQGVWYITDPIHYPADTGTVRLLLEDIASARGLVVPKNEWGERELGFDPPRIVIEVDEALESGVRTSQVEIGAPDLDRIRLNVRVGGRYLRSLVRLYTTLNHIPNDFRSRRGLTIAGETVIELHRSGRVVYEVDGEPHDLELHAFRDGLNWYASSPTRALLSGLDVGVLVFGAARLNIESFVDDEVSDLSRYALDFPQIRVDFTTGAGVTEALLLSRPSLSSRWYLKRMDAPYVWSLDDQSALRLLYPTEEMYDKHFMRVLRNDVSSLRLVSGPGAEIRMDRTPQGWVVKRTLGDEAFSAPLPADAQRIEDELARLEDLELSLLPEGLDGPDLRELVLDGAVYLDAGGKTLGGKIGRARDGELADAGVLFRRVDDELVLVGEDWLVELVKTPMDEFRSKELVRLFENHLEGLRISSAEKTVRYTHDKYGIWHPEGEQREAKELLALLDPLIFLKAESFLGQSAALRGAIEVVFEQRDEEDLSISIGAGDERDGQPTSVAEVGGTRSRLRAGQLFEQLSGLLQP